MNKMMKVVKGTGKVIMAILTGIFMPILLWVGLGMALNKKLREKQQVPEKARTIGEILDGAEAELEDMFK
jgi:hypothetical protein